MKLENLKLQIVLSLTKAKVMVYETKIKSLKNYCKVLEANNFNRLSRSILKTSWD